MEHSGADNNQPIKCFRLDLLLLIWWLCRSCVLDFLSAGEATVVSWELLSLYHQYGLGLWGAGAVAM